MPAAFFYEHGNYQVQVRSNGFLVFALKASPAEAVMAVGHAYSMAPAHKKRGPQMHAALRSDHVCVSYFERLRVMPRATSPRPSNVSTPGSGVLKMKSWGATPNSPAGAWAT
jgi:hypothetical protein